MKSFHIGCCSIIYVLIPFKSNQYRFSVFTYCLPIGIIYLFVRRLVLFPRWLLASWEWYWAVAAELKNSWLSNPRPLSFELSHIGGFGRCSSRFPGFFMIFPGPICNGHHNGDPISKGMTVLWFVVTHPVNCVQFPRHGLSGESFWWRGSNRFSVYPWYIRGHRPISRGTHCHLGAWKYKIVTFHWVR